MLKPPSKTLGFLTFLGGLFPSFWPGFHLSDIKVDDRDVTESPGL